MQRLAIIRSCDRDDFSAHVCYLSIKKHNVADEVVFFHEDGHRHPLILSTGSPVFYHPSCGNYGGLNNVKLMVKYLSQIPVEADYVIFSDADIVFTGNPAMSGEDHGGIFGEALVCPGIPHVSGQLNIIKGWLWNKYIGEGFDAVERAYQYQVKNGVGAGTADDTLFSIYSHRSGAKMKRFSPDEYWVHDKINNSQEYHEFLHKYIR